MIPHHAQALLIAGWTESHAAGAEIRRLAERIIVSQRDEIALASAWLRAHGIDAPDADAARAAAIAHGAAHAHLMPGMLTRAELERLDAARGEAFDRLFLELMIRHHEGAIAMVDRLFASPGAAQDDDVFRFASDVFADQTAEIDRMQRILDAAADGP